MYPSKKMNMFYRGSQSAKAAAGIRRRDESWYRPAGILLNDLGQFAGGVALGHFGQGDRLDLAGIAARAELLVALLANFLGGFASRLQVFARIELAGVLGHESANRARHG